jgi:hypothetical protein
VADRPSARDRPRPYGYEAAMKDAFFIAAPLFTAASLSLAGVVAGADKAFRVPGLTLLMLVASSLVLVAAIQINYYARQFVFTVKDLHEHLGHFSAWEDLGERERTREFVHMREMARDRYRKYARYSAYCFTVGVLLLGVGVGFALAPPDGGKQFVWRWIASVMVFAATVAEGVWIWFLIFKDTAGRQS